jgi:hypothetical protein
MKNVFIKLNLYTNDEVIYININHIISLAPRINCTLIAMPDSPHPDSLYRVKESAEDIIVMINKAQKRWL